VSDLPGVDLDALTRWLDAEHPGLRSGALGAELITGGKSNLTYRITDGRATWALRRPPLGHVLPTAHNMAREYQVIDALGASDVPVPAAIALCTDPDVLGAPFYLMSFVDGVVLDNAAALSKLDHEAAHAACEQLVDTLVALHAVDPVPIGLGAFGRPDGFLLRQVNRWRAQWQASQTRPLPVLDQVFDALLAGLPRSLVSGVVHGDYRLTNVIFRPDVTGIAAVVDWEMATLGDPLTDLGLLVVYQTLSTAIC
jgi:aminoglycoside phosphotransferase (APT) family kinase protein